MLGNSEYSVPEPESDHPFIRLEQQGFHPFSEVRSFMRKNNLFTIREWQRNIFLSKLCSTMKSRMTLKFENIFKEWKYLRCYVEVSKFKLLTIVLWRIQNCDGNISIASELKRVHKFLRELWKIILRTRDAHGPGRAELFMPGGRKPSPERNKVNKKKTKFVVNYHTFLKNIF